MVKRKNNPRTHINEVQRRFEADLYRRLVQDNRDRSTRTPLKSKIRRKVVDEDAFDLTDSGSLSASHSGSLQAYEFPENPERSAEFEEWLDRQVKRGVLVQVGRDRVIDGDHWTSEYIRDAGKQGIKHGNRELRRAGVEPDDTPVGAALRAPVHTDILQAGYLRSYDELDKITSEMATEISRAMSDGLAQGWNPRKTASAMNERVDNVGLTRSRRIARTETMRAYHDHSIARYGEHDIQKVRIVTYNPCDVCENLAADNPYTLEEARGLIPGSTHPNCVCATAPVTN